MLAGLDRLSAGSIVVEGRDLSTMDSEALARHRRLTVGMIFQSFNLVPTMTLADNIELPLRFAETPRSERRSRVLELLTNVGLAHRANHKPSELSGGEQQRGAIARALANRPSVLLADEPTGNLDSRNGQEVMALLRELNEKMGCDRIDGDARSGAGRALCPQVAAHGGWKAGGGGGGAAMMRQDLLELAARNMRNARLRNALTTMGIAVGVASMVAMLSLGIGLQGFANHQLMKSGMFQTVFVTSKQDIRNMEENAEEERRAKPEESPVLNDDARSKIAALPGVEEVVSRGAGDGRGGVRRQDAISRCWRDCRGRRAMKTRWRK